MVSTIGAGRGCAGAGVCAFADSIVITAASNAAIESEFERLMAAR